MKSREDHLNWCKDRALEYVEAGNNVEAVASMTSDMNKHSETRDSSGSLAMLGIQLLSIGAMATKEQGRNWINGFN